MNKLFSNLAIAEAYVIAHKFLDAKPYALKGLNISKKIGMEYHIGLAHRILGEIELQYDENIAKKHLEKSIAIYSDIKAENELALAYVGYAKFQNKIGMNEVACEYLEKALDIFERLGTLQEPEKVKAQLEGF